MKNSHNIQISNNLRFYQSFMEEFLFTMKVILLPWTCFTFMPWKLTLSLPNQAKRADIAEQRQSGNKGLFQLVLYLMPTFASSLIYQHNQYRSAIRNQVLFPKYSMDRHIPHLVFLLHLFSKPKI